MEFFARYDDDEALRERVRLAEEYYPGSLELREIGRASCRERV